MITIRGQTLPIETETSFLQNTRSLHIPITVRTSSQGRRCTIDKSAAQPVDELAIGGYYLCQEGSAKLGSSDS